MRGCFKPDTKAQGRAVQEFDFRTVRGQFKRVKGQFELEFFADHRVQ
jgi:hypothetical protein